MKFPEIETIRKNCAFLFRKLSPRGARDRCRRRRDHTPRNFGKHEDPHRRKDKFPRAPAADQTTPRVFHSENISS